MAQLDDAVEHLLSAGCVTRSAVRLSGQILMPPWFPIEFAPRLELFSAANACFEQFSQLPAGARKPGVQAH